MNIHNYQHLPAILMWSSPNQTRLSISHFEFISHWDPIFFTTKGLSVFRLYSVRIPFWLAVLTILKNDGVRQWLVDYPIYEMEHINFMFETTNQPLHPQYIPNISLLHPHLDHHFGCFNPHNFNWFLTEITLHRFRSPQQLSVTFSWWSKSSVPQNSAVGLVFFWSCQKSLVFVGQDMWKRYPLVMSK